MNTNQASLQEQPINGFLNKKPLIGKQFNWVLWGTVSAVLTAIIVYACWVLIRKRQHKSCVKSEDKVKDLKNEIDKLVSENTLLKTELDTLKDKNTSVTNNAAAATNTLTDFTVENVEK